MVRNGKMVFLGMSAFTGMLAVWSSLAGCQGGTSATTGASTNAGGSGGAGATTTASSATNSGGAGTTSSASSMTTTTTGSSMGTGGSTAMTATITDVTTDKIGPGIEVSLKGVVAMSQKFLVSKGSSGSCLWGVFVSEPGLAETKASSGIIALSYGVNASISGDAGKAFCPRLGVDPIGDAIPDDVCAGDVLDLTGETAYFLLPQCAMQPMGSTVGQYQIAKINPGAITRTKTKGPVPAAHKLTAADYAMLASPSNQAFHAMWGNVKVEIDNAVSEPQDDGTGMMGITDKFGHILVHEGTNLMPAATDKVQVGDKIFYRGYAKAQNFCNDGPKYPVATTTFTAIDGFNYLDFCTWNVQPNNKCSDLTPPSPVATDCNSMSNACP
ncbi:MAG: hypothetical protein ABJE95_26000 [Byssovorax sp.]